MKIVIKRFDLTHVISYDKKLYNTNNHFIRDKREMPKDYYEKGNMCNTSFWIDKFHEPGTYHVITLDSSDLFWLKKAFLIGSETERFPDMYKDELDQACQELVTKFPEGKWFVRTDLVSLKYGKYGCGPYSTIEEVLISMATSIGGHACFRENSTTCNIYLLPWKNIPRFKEFRIFVYQNRITAISDQDLYRINEWLNSLSDEEICITVEMIVNYFENHIRDKLLYFGGNYVMDLALIDVQAEQTKKEEIPYFIEVNPFGKDYSSGSSLFHWENDHNILHNTKSDSIEFRYTSCKTIQEDK